MFIYDTRAHWRFKFYETIWASRALQIPGLKRIKNLVNPDGGLKPRFCHNGAREPSTTKKDYYYNGKIFFNLAF